MIRHTTRICVTLVFSCAISAFAQKPLPPDGAAPNGIQNFCTDANCIDSLWMYKRLYKTEPTSPVRAFVSAGELKLSERMLVSRANELFDSNSIIGMMLIEKNRVLFERYKSPIEASSALAGFSMSKSIASMTVGMALCAGEKITIDTKAADLSIDLSGTAQGEATIHQLLTMTSGGLRGTLSMGAWPETGQQIGSTIYSGYKNIPKLVKDYGGRQVKTDKPSELVMPGEEFSYKNMDYIALSLALSADSPQGFNKYFSEYLAPSIGFEAPVYWVHDELGHSYTSTSFHAVMRDWARVAKFVTEAIGDQSNSCYSKFIKSATKTQVKNQSARYGPDFRSGSNFGGYGYGFWTENNAKPSAIYFVGARGQRIAIDPSGQKIMVVFSIDEKSVYDIPRFFAQW